MSGEPRTRMPCRLAIRREGNFVNAYLALDDTMEDAQLLGSLSMWVAQDPEMWQQWRELMREACARQVQRITGVKPVLNRTVRAPEHERSGHG
jgi:hypothetical protein